MNITNICLLNWIALWTDLRALFYSPRTSRGPREIRWFRISLIMLVCVALIYGLPVAAASSVQQLLRTQGIPPHGLVALVWLVIVLISLLYGFIASLGATLQPALAQSLPLLMFPVARCDFVFSRLLALVAEGLFWFMLLGVPMLVESSLICGAGIRELLATVGVSAVWVVLGTSVGSIFGSILLVASACHDRSTVVQRIVLGAITGGALVVMTLIVLGVGSETLLSSSLHRLLTLADSYPFTRLLNASVGATNARVDMLSLWVVPLALGAAAFVLAFRVMLSAYERLRILEGE
ncbi:MAG: hypothetical protein GXX84_09375 [Acidobacteria bacterium]|nr:hypothetical protein [Acidobacteriota bacterium]